MRSMCRGRIIELGKVITGNEQDESLRLALLIAIMDAVFANGLVAVALSLSEQAQSYSRYVRIELYKFIDQYCYQDKVSANSNVPAAIVQELQNSASSLNQHFATESTETKENQRELWAATALLLSALAALVSQESGEHFLRVQRIQDSISSVITILGLAHKHIPRSKSGRQEIETNSTLMIPNVKRDCITIISNLSHGNKKIQDIVREESGLPLVLAQCNIDDLNPYLREHAMYCVRNLLDNNTENQEVVNTLQPVGVEQTPELSEAGYRADMKDGLVGINRIAKIESINEE